jgi:aminoglycoside phosphotransferase (APT) family kinase protein
VGIRQPGLAEAEATLIGKVRARRFGKSGFRLLERVWNAGFNAGSADGISVPEPLGLVPRFQMWFQRKVPGQTATQLLAGPDGTRLAARVAEAIHKLHRANVPAERSHHMADELRILHECLVKVMEQKPDWRARLEKVLQASDALGASVPAPQECGIHRDFYPAQVVVDGERIYLIDFDLYCLGDPALDVGNFLGHMTEQSLRELGDVRAMGEQEAALEERFIELSGEKTRPAVRAYATLTLVRHIYLSTQFENRRQFTEPLLSLCEQRLL